MPGFIGQIGKTTYSFCKETRKNILQNWIVQKNRYQIQQRTVSKFLNDKLFVETDKYVVVIDGVVLNKYQLIKDYNVNDWLNCVILMYETLNDTFFSSWRGSFNGALFDKKLDKWIVFTDHIGDKQVFYYKSNDCVLFGSEMDILVKTLKENGQTLTIRKDAAYFAITHGFFIENQTLVNEINKLPAGYYLIIQNKMIQQCQFHRFHNVPNESMTEQEAIDGIDKYFRNAVKLQFEKDREYGYKHITCLSGGLDSRMTVWVAHQMGYTRQLNTTFCQSNYLDFSISQQIATDLNHDYIFKALDGGNFMMDADEISKITYGQTCYFGLAHGNSLYKNINFDDYGIIHTGMIGDSIIGTFFSKFEYNKEYKVGQGAYSTTLIDRLKDYKFQQDYDNEEIFCLYTRAFSGANAGMTLFQQWTETCSPFCDVDFIEFCYSIPLRLRYNHKIYFDWILQCYPDAANYIWEKIGKKIERIDNRIPNTMNILGKQIPAVGDPSFNKWFVGFLKRRVYRLCLPFIKSKKSVGLGMNPLDLWYANNLDVKNFLDSYWDGNDVLKDKLLNDDLKYLYDNGTIFNKVQVISLISAIKQIQ